MNKYLMIARKYRPQFFKDVIGQETIIQTLKNSLQYHRDAHAYLFSGPLGTGKTTLARLYAKALNCPNLSSENEPCNHCRSCQEITSSSSLDVIEIDGASNRGIDDIRQINETVGYAPTAGKYKIIIIDEVHMLTKEAFNALLKTLEEPPKTIKFFFATTEPHKIPPTIISRTQHFELKPIAIQQLIENLSFIAKDLQRSLTPEALYLIAKLSQGSLRNAQSLLDQLFCYTEETITEEMIIHTLGLIPHDLFFLLDEAFHIHDLTFSFTFVDKIIVAGKDLLFFTEKLLEHYRSILFILLQGLDHPQLSLSAHLKRNYSKTAFYYTPEQCFHIMQLIMATIVSLPKSLHKKIDVEMLILQILKTKHLLSPTALTQRLISLEHKINTAPSTNSPSPPSSDSDPSIVLEKVPFSLSPSTPPLDPISHSSQTITSQKNDHDTLLQFSAVELEGIIHKP
ncbi:MAG: DNA polymerase III subunit gamma/tau [Parachlamydiales bacterium]|nr:DNA polymerase III subunit gamma/tau [Parachlamydiales bacterium]